jgi:hypothetical protein
VPPRLAGAWPLGGDVSRDFCDDRVSCDCGRCGVREACADGCFGAGLAFRAGAFGPGGGTVGVALPAAVCLDAIGDGVTPANPTGTPPSLVIATMSPSASAASNKPLDNMRNGLIAPFPRKGSPGHASAQPTLIRVRNLRRFAIIRIFETPTVARATFW